MSPALSPTAGQTVGPFFGYALPYDRDSELVPPGHPRAVRLYGRVIDGAGQPVPDALLELWQLDEAGSVVQQEGSLRRDGWTFTGWGRASTDDTGTYTFTTLKPGAEPGKAAFFLITLFARGLPNRLFTRAYIPQDAAVLEADPLLSSLPEPERATLISRADEGGFRFDIVMQGDGRDGVPALPGTLRDDRFVLAGRRARRRPDERLGSADGNGIGRERLAGRACRTQNRAGGGTGRDPRAAERKRPRRPG